MGDLEKAILARCNTSGSTIIRAMTEVV